MTDPKCRMLPLLVALVATPVLAQSTLDWPVGEFSPYHLDSGSVANPERGFSVVFEAAVTVENAVWLRLYFGEAELDAGSFVRMTSALDGEVQELDAEGMAMWSNTSAYFNGDTVYLELIAAPQTGRNHVVLEQVATYQVAGAGRGDRSCGASGCGYCSGDDRVPSDEDWAGRLLPVGCTGSIYDQQSCAVTAGHCVSGGGAQVMQVRVPDSLSNCNLVNPGIAEQFPVIDYVYLHGGPGADWAAMRTGTNNLGQTPYERYGVYRPIASAAADAGDPVAVWGYGVDDSPDPTRNQTQQTGSGTINARFSTLYRFSVDITYGNSGSGLIYDGEIIGIVTHCPCPNIATRTDLPSFVMAREELCGAWDFCAAGSASTGFEHIERVQLGTIDNFSGSSGYADYTALSTEMLPETDHSLTVTLGSAHGDDIGGLWIDWNQDKEFDDPGEEISISWAGSGPYTTTITPPDGTPPGSARIRIRVQDSNYDSTLGPCGTTSYGEVEDYTIVVLPPPDVTPPTPDPMDFALVPTANYPDRLWMWAAEAEDADTPPVEYYFEFVGGGPGGDSSDWQSSVIHADYGLQPDTSYGYRVTARDSYSPPNETAYSAVHYAITKAAVPGAAVLTAVDCSSMDIEVTPNGNPAVTIYSIQCTATSPYDANWDGQYVSAAGTPLASAQWQTEAQWNPTRLTGMQPEASYTFAVTAQNQEGFLTNPGPEAALSIAKCGDGDMDEDLDVDLFDFALWQVCFGVTPAAPACAEGDFDGNGAINLSDFADFSTSLGGPF